MNEYDQLSLFEVDSLIVAYAEGIIRVKSYPFLNQAMIDTLQKFLSRKVELESKEKAA